MSDWQAIAGIAGMAAITVITRGFFLLSERELPLPRWTTRGLKYAPLAALVAVIAPEIVLADGEILHTWQDARLYAVAAATVFFVWKRNILVTILGGMVVMLGLRLGLGW